MRYSLSLLCSLLLLSWIARAQKMEKSTALPGVEVREHAIYVPFSASYRTIRVFTPSSYPTGTGRYPVIYALDAQNLFDDRSSFVGEWKLDEAMDSLAGRKHPEAIVVGIDNHGAFRTQEYNLFNSEQYGPGLGRNFLDFLVADLKSYIDREYRTLRGREHTAIIGSSMGGLIAFSALLQYPDVFSKAGVYSPSFWISEDYYSLPGKSDIRNPVKLYMTVGEEEGDVMKNPFRRMRDSLETYLEQDALKIQIVPGGKHSESSWAREFPISYSWWFSTDK